jgi:hypothetical protein
LQSCPNERCGLSWRVARVWTSNAALFYSWCHLERSKGRVERSEVLGGRVSDIGGILIRRSERVFAKDGGLYVSSCQC